MDTFATQMFEFYNNPQARQDFLDLMRRESRARIQKQYDLERAKRLAEGEPIVTHTMGRPGDIVTFGKGRCRLLSFFKKNEQHLGTFEFENLDTGVRFKMAFMTAAMHMTVLPVQPRACIVVK